MGRIVVSIATAVGAGSIVFASAAGGAAGASSAAHSRNNKVVTIGAIYPLTGSLASYGVAAKKAITCAADMVNMDPRLARASGLTTSKKIRVDFANAPDPATGVADAQRLIKQDHVVALTGSYDSGITATASQVANEYHIPFVNGDSAASDLTTRGFKYFFRTTPLESGISASAIKFLKQLFASHGQKHFTVGLVQDTSAFGQSSGQSLRTTAVRDGLHVAADVSYPENSSDLTSVVLKLKAAHPDAVILSSYVSDAVLLTKEFRQLHFAPKAVVGVNGTDVPGYIGGLGNKANNVFSISLLPTGAGAKKPIVRQVNAFCTKKTGAALNDSSGRAFTGAVVLINAIDRASTPTPSGIERALLKTNLTGKDMIMPWKGVKFASKTHQNTEAGIVFQQIISKKYYTVWPSKLATHKTVFPAPPGGAA